MKLIKKTAIATVMVLGVLGMGSASAVTLDSLPGVSSANLNVVVKDGVATIFGTTDSSIERKIAERHVAKLDGVDRVINLVTFQ